MKNAKKFASFILAICMIVSVIPAFAEDESADYIPIELFASPLSDQLGLGFLLRGFNVLSGQQLFNNTISRADIINTEAASFLYDMYDATPANWTTANTYSGRSVYDWGISAGLDMSVSTDVSAGLGKLFKASAHSKFGMTANASYQSSYDSQFFNMNVNHIEYVNYIKNINSALTKNAIQSALAQEFLDALINATDIKSEIFDVYGTHFITSYGMGGWVENTISAINTKENISADLKTSFEASGGVSMPGIAAKTAVELETSVSGYSNNADYVIQTNQNVVGGSGGVSFTEDANTNTTVINGWTNSFVRTGIGANCYILTDENLELTGIWELLPAGYLNRYNELVSEYIRLSREQDFGFLNEFLYKAAASAGKEQVPAYDVYEEITGPIKQPDGNPIFIRNAAEFAMIGASSAYPLNGNYILAADINLNDASINTGSDIFTGTFDGNNHTIKNFTIDKKSITAKTTYAGLFPRIGPAGVVKNLTIENAQISVNNFMDLGFNSTFDALSNASVQSGRSVYTTKSPYLYGGVIAGRNEGTIENVLISDSRVDMVLFCNGYTDNTAYVYAGGVAGYNTGKILNSFFDSPSLPTNDNRVFGATLMQGGGGDSSNYVRTGGVVGYSSGGHIHDSYSYTHVRSYSSASRSHVNYGSGVWTYEPNIYLSTGGVIGYATGASIEGCFSMGEVSSDYRTRAATSGANARMYGVNNPATPKNGKPVVQNYTGEIVGGSSTKITFVNIIIPVITPTTTLTDSFYRTGRQSPVGNSSVTTGTTPVTDFNLDLVKTALYARGWTEGASHPIPPITSSSDSGKALIIQWLDGIPEFVQGEKMPVLSSIVKIWYAESVYEFPYKDVTNQVTARYNFVESGQQPIQFSYGNYYSTVISEVSPIKIPVIGATITQLDTFTYDGSTKTPTFTVVVGGETLVAGIDYTVSGSATNAGTGHTATITGIGMYTGTYNANWTINKANPVVTFPTGATLFYGETLSQAVLAGQRSCS